MSLKRTKDTRNMTHLFIGVAVTLFVLIGIGIAIMLKLSPSTGIVIIGDNVVVKVDLAVTPAEQARGLSGREGLGEDEGLLFLLPTSREYGFWMKDMLFPIDILWIQDGVIIDITENAEVPTSPYNLPQYSPIGPVDTVLEVNAGFVDKHDLRLGTSVRYKVDNR